ncbi:MAG: penicillin-insensitive murein endopeptidase [Rhodovarius sp.]|nr:penicillin-insensitive murein endopeptidase [Rhodovarius sp.]
MELARRRGFRLGRGAIALLLSLALGPAWASAQPSSGEAWARHTAPTPGPTRVIGAPSLGCLAGAVPLPPEGPGWQAVRLSRNRHWGTPELVRFIQELAARAQAEGLPDLLIGDMSQPRGGPMPWGHASHQTGLDVDIWLDLRRHGVLSRAAREEITFPSLVLPDHSAADPALFTEGHARLIRLAATAAGVDRVLVHHGIKRSLCAAYRGEEWLRRVRPWRGHDSHMHVRLRCPAGQPDCRDAPPPPPGDGCDASLEWWLTEEAQRPPPRPPGPPPSLPPACAAVFAAP